MVCSSNVGVPVMTVHLPLRLETRVIRDLSHRCNTLDMEFDWLGYVFDAKLIDSESCLIDLTMH